MNRHPSEAPDPRVLRTCVAEARRTSAPSQSQLSPAKALRRGIASYMPFPIGQAKSFGGIHLEAISQALDWLTTGKKHAKGIVVTGRGRCVFIIACIQGVAWVLDLLPCPGLRGDIDRSTLWAAFDCLQDAMSYLRWRYPAGGPWGGWEGNTVVAWATDAART